MSAFDPVSKGTVELYTSRLIGLRLAEVKPLLCTGDTSSAYQDIFVEWIHGVLKGEIAEVFRSRSGVDMGRQRRGGWRLNIRSTHPRRKLRRDLAVDDAKIRSGLKLVIGALRYGSAQFNPTLNMSSTQSHNTLFKELRK